MRSTNPPKEDEVTTYDYDAYYLTPLSKGSHNSPDQGLCLMELTALFAREEHSDHPRCVSPVLGEFGRNLNDVLPDPLRQELKALIPSLPGTAGDGMDECRGYMALDWLIRTWLPAWLDLVPACRPDATRLRELDRVVDLVAAEHAGVVVRTAKTRAAAAGAAARDAAWAAARDAARAAAWDAAWAAARAAARDAAWAAARAAARDAAWAAARDAAWAAAGAAARDAAWDAARAAAWDAAWAAARAAAWDAAWAAAGAAARDALAPTVEELQRSAIDLYRDMIKSPGAVPVLEVSW